MPDPYAELKERFAGDKRVIVSAGQGAQGMKVGKKMFAIFYKGDLLLTLPPKRVEELISAGRGLPYDPGTGKAMKNRILVPAAKKDSWVRLCEEAVTSF
jgi:hypothetical protein